MNISTDSIRNNKEISAGSTKDAFKLMRLVEKITKNKMTIELTQPKLANILKYQRFFKHEASAKISLKIFTIQGVGRLLVE